jgi:hypothetical protein
MALCEAQVLPGMEQAPCERLHLSNIDYSNSRQRRRQYQQHRLVKKIKMGLALLLAKVLLSMHCKSKSGAEGQNLRATRAGPFADFVPFIYQYGL